MSDQLYSAEEAAEILGLQVRTVRNYVREGRLPGVRIGKQYRITRADLDSFTGGGGPATESRAAPPHEVQAAASITVHVSSVVQVDGISTEDADRIVRTVTAVLAGRSPSEPQLRTEPLYDPERRRLKVIIVGRPADSAEMIRIIDAVSRGGD